MLNYARRKVFAAPDILSPPETFRRRRALDAPLASPYLSVLFLF
jgi:hypothetical protein